MEKKYVDVDMNELKKIREEMDENTLLILDLGNIPEDVDREEIGTLNDNDFHYEV